MKAPVPSHRAYIYLFAKPMSHPNHSSALYNLREQNLRVKNPKFLTLSNSGILDLTPINMSATHIIILMGDFPQMENAQHHLPLCLT